MKISLIFLASSLLFVGNIVFGMEEGGLVPSEPRPAIKPKPKDHPRLIALLSDIARDPDSNRLDFLEPEKNPNSYHMQLQKQFGDPPLPPQRSKTPPPAHENHRQVVLWGQPQGYKQNFSQIFSVLLSFLWG